MRNRITAMKACTKKSDGIVYFLGFELCMFCADNIEYMTIMYRLTLKRCAINSCVNTIYSIHHVQLIQKHKHILK